MSPQRFRGSSVVTTAGVVKHAGAPACLPICHP